MKILVIFTGGTIGSSIKKGWADVDSTTHFALLSGYENNADIEFVTSSPFSVLSENLSFSELNLLQKEIAENIEKNFDGIIVTHGTDTLQYAAAAVEYAFNGIGLPIIFVSADYPLEDTRTNGYKNFEAAVEFIRAKLSNGVFASYKNNNQDDTAIHIASRILQHGEYDANIYSINGDPFTTYNGNGFSKNHSLDTKNNIGVVEYVKNHGILSIESHPGNDYAYSLDSVKAVMLKPYHSGTLDTANDGLKEFCMRAKENNIPVFVANASGDVSYKSTSAYSELGLISVPYSTYISLYMKIWAAISLERSIADFVIDKIANEYID